MSSIKSYRSQNLNPEGLIQSRKTIAQKNEDAVRVTIQAIRQRKVTSHEVTVQLVARESGVSAATIYRRDKLFALVRQMNPTLQRRHAEKEYRDKFAQLESALADARNEIEYLKNKTELSKLDCKRLQQENTLLRKKLLDLQR